MITVKNITEVFTRLQNEILTNKPNMKNLIKLLSLLTLAGFILTSCETCKLCHNPTVVDAVAVQYELSKHSWGEAAFEEAGNTSCAPCHESEGFKYVIKNNVTTAFSIVSPATTYSNPYVSSTSTAYGAIGCFTCHSSLHTTFAGTDFSPLTTVAAVPLTMWGGAKSINLTQDGGMSNLCVRCHQPRPFTNSNGNKNVLNYAGLVSAPTGIFYDAAQSNSLNVLKPGYRTHTHYGTAGAVFAGTGGVEFSGTLSYTSSTHTTAASCQDCHMAGMKGAAGGHTFTAKGNFNGCTPCHASVTNTAQDAAYWATPRAEIMSLLDQLAAKLTIGGVDILNRNGDSESNLWVSQTTNKYDGYLNIYDPITNPSVETYNASSFQYIGTPPNTWSQAQKDYNATLTKITLTNAQMGAIINFQMCLRDYSLGIHNYKYTKALLTNSIAIL
jgi:hypothetical protein